jgi:t-SNARE complex subunit (syntaxin)
MPDFWTNLGESAGNLLTGTLDSATNIITGIGENVQANVDVQQANAQQIAANAAATASAMEEAAAAAQYQREQATKALTWIGLLFLLVIVILVYIKMKK